MTLFHFFTNFLLTFLSPYIVYISKRDINNNSSSSSNTTTSTTKTEERNFRNVFLGILTYGVTLFVKIFLITIFIQNEENNENLMTGTISFSSNKSLQNSLQNLTFYIIEIFKILINSIDLIGIYLLINSKSLNGNFITQIFGVAIGWNLGDCILQRLLPLWIISYRNVIFNWKGLQLSIFSNIYLFECISCVIFIFLFSRKKLFEKKQFYFILLFIYSFIYPLVLEVFKNLFLNSIFGNVDSIWVYLVVRGVCGFIFYWIASNQLEQYGKKYV
ncbi:hypothetical protein ABK040_016642 [Willaertia magna]